MDDKQEPWWELYWRRGEVIKPSLIWMRVMEGDENNKSLMLQSF